MHLGSGLLIKEINAHRIGTKGSTTPYWFNVAPVYLLELLMEMSFYDPRVFEGCYRDIQMKILVCFQQISVVTILEY